MDIDYTKNYKILLNWGVFKDHEDTSLEYFYGAQKLEHA